jgi:hypothetical protein
MSAPAPAPKAVPFCTLSAAANGVVVFPTAE